MIEVQVANNTESELYDICQDALCDLLSMTLDDSYTNCHTEQINACFSTSLVIQLIIFIVLHTLI